MKEAKNFMRIWSETDIGMIRRENQDNLKIRDDMPSGHTVCVVCDGMGGPAGGKTASDIAVNIYLSELEKLLKSDMTDPRILSGVSCQAVSKANRAIREAAEKNRNYSDMGTTLVSAIALPDGAVVTNVGDSRAYAIRRESNSIQRVTRDHSLVQNMIDRGDITPEEARFHPQRNIITRALGPDENVKCDGYYTAMKPGDLILLCTDGLTNMVSDEEILREVLNGGEDCLKRLIEIVKQRGAPDNVTAILLEWPDKGGI